MGESWSTHQTSTGQGRSTACSLKLRCLVKLSIQPLTDAVRTAHAAHGQSEIPPRGAELNRLLAALPAEGQTALASCKRDLEESVRQEVMQAGLSFQTVVSDGQLTHDGMWRSTVPYALKHLAPDGTKLPTIENPSHIGAAPARVPVGESLRDRVFQLLGGLLEAEAPPGFKITAQLYDDRLFYRVTATLVPPEGTAR